MRRSKLTVLRKNPRGSDGLRDLKYYLADDLLKKIMEMGLYPDPNEDYSNDKEK